MKSIVLLLVLVAFAAAVLAETHIPIPVKSSSNGSPIPLTEQEMQSLFSQFLAKYDKVYSSNEVEMKKRFTIFKFNVEKARMYNHVTRDDVYGITKFFDLDEVEFQNKYLMKPFTAEQFRRQTRFGSIANYRSFNAPESFDWREHGAVTPVKNQGSCGSCWAFSTTGNIEGQWYLQKKELVPLSEQNLVDCDHQCEPNDPNVCNAGCGGGLMWLSFQHIVNAGGIATEKAYPYTAKNGQCHYNETMRGATVSSWKMLPTNEDELAAWLAANGPVAVAVNASWLQFYTKGISDPAMCNPDGLNHAVLLVGYGTGKSLFGKEKKYWIVKNSWGTSWGEHGYFRILRGHNRCGISAVPCSAFV